MDLGDKLQELKLTTDEINRFTNAFKDPKFKEILQDYAKEISDPENKRIYEEEITRLEQERGMDIQFIHPEPCRVLKTTVGGKQKCFINICSTESIGKPEFKTGRSADGSTPGQHWSLPHSTAPGRPDRDSEGNKFMIYDIVFHPDTLHIAGKNRRFMEMVDDIAVEAIQDRFQVKLDKKNTRVLKIKYKGAPHASVIRKPIPGHSEKEKPAHPDPLSFPYPDEKRPDTAPKDDPKVKAKPSQTLLNSDIAPAGGPTEPNYTLKYREHIDLQDFRCSRDSARSRRPKEIVMVVDLPLISSVGELDLEVTERAVLLQSREPGYRLEVPLGYPVDYDKGEAKFNKLTKQLTINLPVLPASLTFVPVAGSEEEEGEDGDQAEWSEDKSASPGQRDASDHLVSTTSDGSEAADCGADPASSFHAGSQPDAVLRDREGTDQPPGLEGGQEHLPDEAETADAPKSNSQTGEEEEIKEESQPLSPISSLVDEMALSATASSIEPQPVNRQVPDGPAPRGETEGPIAGREGEIGGETEGRRKEAGGLKRENVERGLEAETGGLDSGAEGKPTPTTAQVSKKAVHFSEDVAPQQKELEEGVDEDDMPSEQTSEEDCDRKPFVPAPAELREIGEDRQEVVIRDHSTSAGFSFGNSLLFDLD